MDSQTVEVMRRYGRDNRLLGSAQEKLGRRRTQENIDEYNELVVDVGMHEYYLVNMGMMRREDAMFINRYLETCVEDES
jgi:hypothetical protein